MSESKLINNIQRKLNILQRETYMWYVKLVYVDKRWSLRNAKDDSLRIEGTLDEINEYINSSGSDVLNETRKELHEQILYYEESVKGYKERTQHLAELIVGWTGE